MDDFGAGYSSLNMFKDAPVDIIKLDMGFISSDEINAQRSFAIIEAIVKLSHSLNVPVIVEGVETQAQVDFLKSINTRYIQGYYFSRSGPGGGLCGFVSNSGSAAEKSLRIKIFLT